MIDIHSHILPGIDDGARSFDESVEIVRELSLHGVTDVIATPHFIRDTKYVSPVINNKVLLQELKKQLKGRKIDVGVYLGNEIYIDEDIIGLIKAGRISPLAGSKYLLVELPLNDEFPNYEDHLSSLMSAGYKVILAHPERYRIVKEDYSVIENLYDMGILLQCNIGSIGGKYGKNAQKIVKKLAKDKKIFAFGSDTHHPGGGRHLDLAYKKLARYYNKPELVKLLVENPRKIIGR